MEEQEQRQTDDAPAAAAAPEAPAASGAEADGAAAAAGNESLPAAAAQSFGGSSEVADGKESQENKEAKEGEDLKGIYGAAKDLKGALKIKPGFGGVTDVTNAIDTGKETAAAVKAGDYGTATSKAIQTGGEVVKDLAPAVAKLAPSLAPAASVAAPIATGAVVGAKVADYGDQASTDNQTLQRVFGAAGLRNADGSPTSVTDAGRNLGDQAGAAVTRFTGSETAGKVAGVATKLGSAIPAAPLLIGSAGAGAAKYLWGQGKKLFGMKDG